MKYILFTGALLFAQTLCSAQSQSQSEMNQQSAVDLKKVDDVMTAAYKNAMAAQDENGKKLLLEAQRAWIKYKEAHCKSIAHPNEGGSIYPLIYNGCLTDLTKTRTKELKELLDQGN